MKIVEKENSRVVFQGDIALIKVESLPAKNKVENTDIVAHSETGHHHVATNCDVFSIPGDPLSLFIKAKGDHIDIVHKRPYDTHETLRFYTNPGDTFKIRRQREWSPEGWRKVED